MFYFSASALRNYLDCKYKYYLTNVLKVEKPTTLPMALGSAVHEAIEKNEDNNLSGMYQTFQDGILTILSGGKIQINSAKESVSKYLLMGRAQLEAYCRAVQQLEPLSYQKEYKFEVPLDTDITLVGRIDQIRGDKIYDIKTGEYPPSEEAKKKDLQFTIYAYAYEKHFSKSPESLCWFHLGYKEKRKEKLIEGISQIHIMENRTENDFNEMSYIIRNVVSDIKDEKFYPEYGYQCRTCLVKRFCILE